jgi:hypothetical protein
MSDGLRYQGTIVSRGKIVPLISSYVSGPLGLIHLPRLWLKALLHAHDRLAEDWGCGPGGLDKIIADYVGIDKGPFISWLTKELPTYEQCEQWVRENATNLTSEAITESNARLLHGRLPGDLNAQFRSHMQIDDDSVEVGLMLNTLDDWDTVHRYALANRADLEPIVPAISPLTAGLLGVPQVARQWLKDVLFALSALPPSYSLVHEAADDTVPEQLGIDPPTARAHVRDLLPGYLQYERWLRERTTEERLNSARGQEGAVITAAATAHATDWGLLHAMLARPGANPASGTGIFAFSITPLVQR